MRLTSPLSGADAGGKGFGGEGLQPLIALNRIHFRRFPI